MVLGGAVNAGRWRRPARKLLKRMVQDKRIEPATAKGFLASNMATGDLAGDYRDLDRILAWAREIAADLKAAPG